MNRDVYFALEVLEGIDDYACQDLHYVHFLVWGFEEVGKNHLLDAG